MESKALKIIIGLVVVLILAVGIYLIFFVPKGVANLALQVNPAITLTLDARNTVIEAEGLDASGELLLEGLVITGKEISEALRIITEAMRETGFLGEERRMLIALNPIEDRIGQDKLVALTSVVDQTLRGYMMERGLVIEVTSVVLTEELADAVRVVGLFPADYVDVVVEVGAPLALQIVGLQKELGLDQTLFKDEFGTIGAAIIDMMETGITGDNSLTIIRGALVADPTLEELTTITAAMIDLYEVGATQESIMAAFTLMEEQLVLGVDRTLLLEEFTTITAAKADMLEAGIPAETALSTLRIALRADPKLEELTTITAAMIDLIEEGLTKEESLARIQAAVQADPTLQNFDELIEEPIIPIPLPRVPPIIDPQDPNNAIEPVLPPDVRRQQPVEPLSPVPDEEY